MEKKAEMGKKVMRKLKEEVGTRGLTLSITEKVKAGKSIVIASCDSLEGKLREYSKG